MQFLKLIIFFFFISNFAVTEKLTIAFPGLAKVGKSCFLNLTVKDNSSYKLKNFDIFLYLTDDFKNLLGNAKESLSYLNKNQVYNTSIDINLFNENSCKLVKNIDVFIKNCTLLNNDKLDQCKSLLEINNKEEIGNLNVEILRNQDFYNLKDNKQYIISELGITLKPASSKLLKKYNIEKENSGMIITNRTNDLFKIGDLIVELEMDEVNNINQFKNIIKKVKKDKQKYIIINFVRNNEKKLILADFK